MIGPDTLDLSALPVWERSAVLMERIGRMQAGDELNFLTSVDPRALIAHIEQGRPGELSFNDRHLGVGEWSVAIRCLHAEDPLTLGGALRRGSVFSALDDDARARIAENMREHSARKNEELLAENSSVTVLGLLLEGSLGVFMGTGRRERLLFTVFPYETFGEIEFLDRGLSVGRTITLSKNARYATIPHAFLDEFASHCPDLLASLGAQVAQRSRTIAAALAAQVSRTIISRVASALLPFAVPERGLQPALAPLPSMTQTKLAASAGTVKEVAARAIAELEHLNALRRERGHVSYLDRSKLLEIASR